MFQREEQNSALERIKAPMGVLVLVGKRVKV